MLKKIILVLASLFLFWQSYGLLNFVSNVELNSWWTTLFIAFLINLFITGIFAFSGFALPTHKLISNSYYKVSNSKRLKKVYAFLQVDVFRKFLLATFWRSKKQQKKYFNGTLEGLSNLELQSKKSEFGHLIPLIIIMAISIYFLILGLITLAIITVTINFIGNLYPIILQRHHRMRIQILRKRMHA